MKLFAILILSGLLAITIIACGGDTASPTATSAPAASSAQATQPPAPTSTTAPEPTVAPTEAPEPTAMPEPTATEAPEPTAMPEPTTPPTPEPTATTAPTPTATPEPEPTATPQPEAAATPEPDPTATPEPTTTPTLTPTPTPEPKPTPVPVLPIAEDLAPLGDNLLWVAYFDGATQTLSAYDPNGTFMPEDALPPGLSVPDPSEIGELTELVSLRIYNVKVSEGMEVELNGASVTLYAGLNSLFWR